jgi:glycosyltransferase involved in cell wall biosynthesis
MPKVSVIIPTYNREKYIVDTINSVLNQTFSDYEIIVVDDGSTDGTERVIREQFPDKISYLSKPNGGPASARNMGMRIATGEYIAFLDSDDLWLPEKLEIQIRYMDSNPKCGLIGSWALTFRGTDSSKIEDVALACPETVPTLQRLLLVNCILLSTVMARASCIEKAGGFDNSLFVLEDYDLWIRLAMHYELANLPRVLARYRLHAGNIYGGASARKVAEDGFKVTDLIQKKFPDLIPKAFGDMKSFYALRYRVAGDNISLFEDPSTKAYYYLKALRISKMDIMLIIKLLVCYAMRIRKTFSHDKVKSLR